MIIETRNGPVRGTVEGGVSRFLGIPYAAAPVGDLRFVRPRPHPGWSDVRPATTYGPTAPHRPYPADLQGVLPTVVIPGEEILNLNVWAPERPADEAGGHPVLVWIHGGGLTRGCNALTTYDGTGFARSGVVLVSLNYRLGAEGFSVLDDAPANLGLSDLVAGLHWVRDNVARFGGDPARVTIAGQSAGGACVAALGASPYAEGLFSAAIIQSGPLEALPVSASRRATRAVARQLGVPATRAAFARVSPEALLEAQAVVTEKSSLLNSGPAFGLVIDGDLLPEDPRRVLADAEHRFPLMLGYTTEEYRLWFMPTGMVNRIRRPHLLAGRLRFKASQRTVRVYSRNRPGARPGEILGMLATDALLRLPMNNLADRRRGATWMYEFAWDSPVLALGAAHGVELPFVFDTLATDEARMLVGSAAPQSLADTMHDTWVRFARDRDPGWTAWDPARPVMVFGQPTSGLTNAPREDERAALAGSR